MGAFPTPPPLDATRHPESVTKTVAAFNVDGGIVGPLIGGVISATLILICLMAFVLWRRSRHKGSYVTHEMDNQDDVDDDDDDDGDEDDDDDSECSDTELQHEVPLEISAKEQSRKV